MAKSSVRQLISKPLQTVAEKIKQRRRQMLVHSYLYYEKDTNIVSDAKWIKWAKELEQLQSEHPDIADKVEYAEQFVDWDGSSGAHLTYDNQIIAIAERLLLLEQTPKQAVKTVIPKKNKGVKRLI